MRATTLAAGGLACAGVAMTIAAFAGGGSAPSPAPAATPTRAAAGQAVFVAQGCGSCHTFAPAGSSGPIGPDLARSLRGKPRDYVIRSIVLPDSESSPNYGTGMMPDDYARRIAPQDLEALTDFLMAGARG